MNKTKLFVCGNWTTHLQQAVSSGGQHHCHECCICPLACASRDRDLSTTPARTLQFSQGSSSQPNPLSQGLIGAGCSSSHSGCAFCQCPCAMEELHRVIWLRVQPQRPQQGVSQPGGGHCRQPLPSALAAVADRTATPQAPAMAKRWSSSDPTNTGRRGNKTEFIKYKKTNKTKMFFAAIRYLRWACTNGTWKYICSRKYFELIIMRCTASTEQPKRIWYWISNLVFL